MADEELEPPVPAPATEAPRRRRWKWPLILLGGFIGIPMLVLAVWTAFAMSYTYSEGDRAGYVQKFSKKGWLCKTWEGELSMVNIPGQAQERWAFTVRRDSIANLIRDAMGKRVALVYEEKRGIPTTCFGETDYFVVGVRSVP